PVISSPPSVPGAHPATFRHTDAASRHVPSAVPSRSHAASPSRHVTATFPSAPATPPTRHVARHSSAAGAPAAARTRSAVRRSACLSRAGVVIVSISEETDACRRRPRGRRCPNPAPPPRKEFVLAPGGQVFWLGDRPHPAPSRPAAVAVTGIVPPYSCGAARALHPLPYSAWG